MTDQTPAKNPYPEFCPDATPSGHCRDRPAVLAYSYSDRNYRVSGIRSLFAHLIRRSPGIGAVVAMVAASKATVGDMVKAANTNTKETP